MICDQKKVAERLNILVTKILTTLQDIKAKPEMQNKRIEQVLPLVDIYMRSMHIIAPDLSALKGSKPIELGVKTNVLMDMFSLLTSATPERALLSDKLRSFIVTLLCPPEPWYNNEINQVDFAQDVLLNPPVDAKPEQVEQMKLIAGTLACQNSKIAMVIFEKKNNLEGLFQEKPSHDLVRFWMNAAHDLTVRTKLQEEDLPIKLYKMIREESPETEKRIIKSSGSTEYKQDIV
jgi:hypothetical protein